MATKRESGPPCDRCKHAGGMRNTLQLNIGGERPNETDNAIAEIVGDWMMAREVCDACSTDPLVWAWLLSEATRELRERETCTTCGLPSDQLLRAAFKSSDHCENCAAPYVPVAPRAP